MGYIVPYFKMQVGDGYSGGHYFDVVRNQKRPEKKRRRSCCCHASSLEVKS